MSQSLAPVFMVFVVVLAYVLGSIPFGLLLTRLAGLGDIRKIGSGNIGATNVLRTGRKGLAAATVLLDGLKGALAVVIGANVNGSAGALICGVAAVVGHLFPVWLRFRGGKGVATGFGVLIAASPIAGLACGAIWLIVAWVFRYSSAAAQRYSSLAELTAAVTSPIFAYVAGLYLDWIDGPKLAAVAAILALILIYKHSANIGRLLNGTEPKIGSEKKAA